MGAIICKRGLPFSKVRMRKVAGHYLPKEILYLISDFSGPLSELSFSLVVPFQVRAIKVSSALTVKISDFLWGRKFNPEVSDFIETSLLRPGNARAMYGIWLQLGCPPSMPISLCRITYTFPKSVPQILWERKEVATASRLVLNPALRWQEEMEIRDRPQTELLINGHMLIQDASDLDKIAVEIIMREPRMRDSDGGKIDIWEKMIPLIVQESAKREKRWPHVKEWGHLLSMEAFFFAEKYTRFRLKNIDLTHIKDHHVADLLLSSGRIKLDWKTTNQYIVNGQLRDLKEIYLNGKEEILSYAYWALRYILLKDQITSRLKGKMFKKYYGVNFIPRCVLYEKGREHRTLVALSEKDPFSFTKLRGCSS